MSYVYYKDLSDNQVYGYETETQQELIAQAVANGWEDVTGSWPPPLEPATIPATVSMRQARLALFQQGILANVQAAIDSLSDPAKTITQISWDYATEVRRDDDLVVQLSGALGLDSAALDALFTLASGL